IGDARVHERAIERRQLGASLAAAGYDRDRFGPLPHAGLTSANRQCLSRTNAAGPRTTSFHPSAAWVRDAAAFLFPSTADCSCPLTAAVVRVLCGSRWGHVDARRWKGPDADATCPVAHWPHRWGGGLAGAARRSPGGPPRPGWVPAAGGG